MDAPRILHCLRAPVGGLFRHVRDLAGEQSKRGYDVAVLCDDQAVDALTEQRLKDLNEVITLGVHRTAMARGIAFSDFSAFRATRNLIQALQIDVAHGHGAKGGAHARLAGRTLRRSGQHVTTIYTPHGGSLNYKPGTAAAHIFLHLERQLIPATDGIVFESAYAQKRYMSAVGGDRIQQRVVFNGLLGEEFTRPRLKADATDFLFIGELRPVKGVDVLLNALAKLNAGASLKAMRALTLTVVGDGRIRANLEALAQQLGLRDVVRFVGAKPAAEAFTMGRCMVVPSRSESFPYVVLEAAAGEIPVIATDVGGISEIVEGSDTGLVMSEDVNGLASAMKDIIDRPEAAAGRAARLRELVGRRFTVETMTDDICAFYADCAGDVAATEAAYRTA